MRTTTRVWEALYEEFGGRHYVLLSIETVEDFVEFHLHAQRARGVNLQLEHSLAAWTEVQVHMSLPAGEEPLTVPAHVLFAAPGGVVVKLDTTTVAQRWQELEEDFGVAALAEAPTAARFNGPHTDQFATPPATQDPRPGVHRTVGGPTSGDFDPPSAPNAPTTRATRTQPTSDDDQSTSTPGGAPTVMPTAQWATPPRQHATLPNDTERAALLSVTARLFTLFEGSLDDCTIREWLTDAGSRKEDGLCTVSVDNKVYYVLLSKGDVVDVQTKPADDSSTEAMLGQTTFIDAKALRAAAAVARRDGRDLGDVLIETKTLDLNTVVCVRHARVGYLMRNLARATAGAFAYTPLEFLPYPARIPPVKY